MIKILVNIKIIFLTLLGSLVGLHFILMNSDSMGLYPIVQPIKTLAFIYYGCIIGDMDIILPLLIVLAIISGIAACLIRLINK